MIDLKCTKKHMLSNIRAGNGSSGDRLQDPADRRFLTRKRACLVVQGRTPEDLLPCLTAALSQRFADVASKHLYRNLLYPLKKAVGNAYKWGNCKMPGKRVTVEAAVSEFGAVITVSDEGAGFDVENTLRMFKNGHKYYTHGGSGFRHFNRMRSVVNYWDGGRTLLIQFSIDQRSETAGQTTSCSSSNPRPKH